MGKRSNFERVERDFYPTPLAAVLPLLPHLPDFLQFAEPCAGDGSLIWHIIGERQDMCCIAAADIEPRGDGITAMDFRDFDISSIDCAIITNPPWDRKILHPMIEHFSNQNPTWLLFDADWIHTKQSIPFLSRLRKVVSVGRVKWIPESKMTGKDNCAWHLFDTPSAEPTQFYGRAAE